MTDDALEMVRTPAAYQFVLDVLATVADYDSHGDIWWKCFGEYAPITFFVPCNNLFYLGGADDEDLKPENLPMLRQSYVDCAAVDAVIYASDLFCCRVRRMRPQRAFFRKDLPVGLRELFEACGPEREDE